MPTVPLIEREVRSQGVGAPQLSQVSGFAAAAAERSQALDGVTQGAANLQNSLQQVALRRQEEADAFSVMEADRKLSEWHNRFMFDPQAGALNRKGKEALDLPRQYSEEFDKQQQELVKTMTPRQRTAFLQASATQRQSGLGTLEKYAFEQSDAWRKNEVEATINTQQQSAALYFNDDKKIGEFANHAWLARQMLGDTNSMSAEAKADERRKVVSPVYYAALQQMVDRDPTRALSYYDSIKTELTAEHIKAAASAMDTIRTNMEAADLVRQASMPAPKSMDDALNFIVDRLEGGDKIAQEPDGAIAKYGINSKANPGVDVANLTREQAMEIYKSRYLPKAQKAMEEVGAQNNPQFALLAIDTVIQSEGKGPELIKESGGDPRKLLQLRDDFYRGLARDNPEKYGQYLNGWMNRLTTAQNMMNGGTGSGFVDFSRMTSNPAVAQKAMALQKDMMTMERQAKERMKDDVINQMYDLKLQGQPIPTTLQAMAKEAGAAKELDSIMGDYESDPAAIAEVKRQIAQGNPVNLNAYQLNAKDRKDLSDLMNDPKKQAELTSVQRYVDDYAPLLIGRKEASTADEYTKLNGFQRRLEQEVKMRRARGDNVTDEDIRGIADALVLPQQEKNWRGALVDSEQPMYMAEGPFKVAGIDVQDDQPRYYLNVGAQAGAMSAVDLVQYVTASLSRKGIRPTNEKVAGEIARLRTSDMLSDIEPGGGSYMPFQRVR